MTELETYIQQQSEAWTTEFVQEYIAELTKRKRSASGELIRSLTAETLAQFERAAITTVIGFEDHGRLIDMRTLQPGQPGQGYIANLIQWLDDKGLREKFIRGYMRRRGLKKRPERILSYIAFGMAQKRFQGKYRRSKTYNRTKTRSVYRLYNTIMAGIPERVAQQLKEGLSRQ